MEAEKTDLQLAAESGCPECGINRAVIEVMVEKPTSPFVLARFVENCSLCALHFWPKILGTDLQPQVLRLDGKIVELTRARKQHQCAVSQEAIVKSERYYSISFAGSGLGSIKFPDRVKAEYLPSYFGGKDRDRDD